jgi:hypothetical protein
MKKFQLFFYLNDEFLPPSQENWWWAFVDHLENDDFPKNFRLLYNLKSIARQLLS